MARRRILFMKCDGEPLTEETVRELDFSARFATSIKTCWMSFFRDSCAGEINADIVRTVDDVTGRITGLLFKGTVFRQRRPDGESVCARTQVEFIIEGLRPLPADFDWVLDALMHASSPRPALQSG